MPTSDSDADLSASEGASAVKRRSDKAAAPRRKRKAAPVVAAAPKAKPPPIDLTNGSTEDDDSDVELPAPFVPSAAKRRRVETSADADDTADVARALGHPPARSTLETVDDSAPLEPGSLVPSVGGGRPHSDPSPRPSAPAPPLPMRPVQERVPTGTQFQRAVKNARRYESDPVEPSSQPVAGPSKPFRAVEVSVPVFAFGAPVPTGAPDALSAVEPPHTQPGSPSAPRLSAIPRAPFAPPEPPYAGPSQQTDQTESIVQTQSPVRPPPIDLDDDEDTGVAEEVIAEPLAAAPAANGVGSNQFDQEAVVAALRSTTSNPLLTPTMRDVFLAFVNDPTEHWVRRAAYASDQSRNRADYGELRRAHSFGEADKYDVKLDMPDEYGGGEAWLTIRPNDGEWSCSREGDEDEPSDEDGEDEGEEGGAMQVDDARQPDYDDDDPVRLLSARPH